MIKFNKGANTIGTFFPIPSDRMEELQAETAKLSIRWDAEKERYPSEMEVIESVIGLAQTPAELGFLGFYSGLYVLQMRLDSEE